jgi:hypothetical protein
MNRFAIAEEPMKRILWAGAFIIALSGAAAPALAHHSLQSEYDINQSITLKGTVTKVDWVNPHVYVYLDVKDDKGVVTKWAVTTLPPGNLRRGGLTRDLLGYGETVSVLAFRARDGANLAFLRTITFADGHTLEIWLGDATKENP